MKTSYISRSFIQNLVYYPWVPLAGGLCTPLKLGLRLRLTVHRVLREREGLTVAS